MERDVEQCAKALEIGGFERVCASEPIRGVLGGPEYKGGCTCTSVAGSSEQMSEGKAKRSEQSRTKGVLGCFEGGTDPGHESSKVSDKLPVDVCKKSSRSS